VADEQIFPYGESCYAIPIPHDQDVITNMGEADAARGSSGDGGAAPARRERHAARATRPLIDGDRLSGFIYGTVTGLVALGAAGSHGADGTWWEVATSVVLGVAALWVAHAYCELLSHRVVIGRHLELRELRAVLSSSWAILLAGVLLSAPLLPVGLGIVSVATATNVSRGLGVTVLALIGFYAEQTGKHHWGRRLLLAGLSAGLGLAVVGAELLLDH
jgi:hypothetical protein